MDLERINELGFEKASRWKTIVLVLSFSMWWNIFIVAQCYLVVLLSTYTLAYEADMSSLFMVRIIIDLFYLFDVVCTIVYLRIYKNLKYTKVRGWLCIVLDVVSLIPFELFYTFHYFQDDKGETFFYILLQNKCLRIYRIFQMESFYKMTFRKNIEYVLLMFLQFLSKAILIAHILTCVWVNTEQYVSCDSSNFHCVLWYETNIATLVIHNWSGEIETFTEFGERIVASMAVFFGFLLIYVHFYPNILYTYMKINYQKALYYQRYQKLQCFLRNMILTADVKKKVVTFFNDVWKADTVGEEVDVLLKNVPLAMKKDIFTDVYWEALRHAELFREVSRSCKRSLSLVMRTVHYHSGEVIYFKGQEALRMMFLVEGTVQIMAEENQQSPVLSFSSGTVFGELSLFLFRRSQAIVKCKNKCELQILTMKAATGVLPDFPKDKKLILHNLRRRLNMARHAQWRKEKFEKEQKLEALDLSSTQMDDDCVKWIKTQWRALWEGHQRHRLVIKAKKEGFRLPSWQRHVLPNVKIDFISNYLDLFVLSDVFEEKKDVVCLKTNLPWSINPSAPFLRFWYFLILFLAFIPSLVYPVCTGWMPTFPWTVYIFSYFVTAMFTIDVILHLLTAIRTRYGIVTKFTKVFSYRLKEFTFYLDVLAALPYQLVILMHYDVSTSPSYIVGMLLHPAILKSHVFITLKPPLSSYVDKLTVIKNCMIYFLLVYWLAEVFQIGVRLELGVPENNWVIRFLRDRDNIEMLKQYAVAVIRALVTAISIPNFDMYPDEDISLIGSALAKFFFFFFFCHFLGDFYGIYTVKIFSKETIRILLNQIQEFVENSFISARVAQRLLKTVRFQWNYDNADSMSSKVSVLKSSPFNLRHQIYEQTTYKTLTACRLFLDEPMELIVEIMERSFLVAVPVGSMLVTLGHTSHMMCVLHRGHCQLISFVSGDVVSGLGLPLLTRSGDIFPLLSSFCNLPSPITVVTLTDCEVIMIHLDDLMNVLIKYKLFKDIVDVVKELGMVEKVKKVKPGLMQLQNSRTFGEEQKENYKKVFRKWGWTGRIMYWFCPREMKCITLRVFQTWMALYTFYVVVIGYLWPCCFGIFIYSSHYLIPSLIFLKGFFLLHIFIQIYSPYYNANGLLVTHPLCTFYNYLTSAFFLDLVYFFPVYDFYRLFFALPYEKPHMVLMIVNFLQLYIKLIHMLGFTDNLEYFFENSYVVRMFKIVLFLSITLNLVINLTMFLNADFIFDGPWQIVGYVIQPHFQPDNRILIEPNSTIDYFNYVSHWILCNVMTTDYLLHQPNDMQLFMSYLQSFIGTIITFYLYAWISSNSVFANVAGTIYQEKITSFVKHLESENANDKLIELALSHYTHEWSRTQGEHLKDIFEHLPVHLHEELVYPLYRPTITRNSLFTHADEGFYKILSTHMTSVFFNRGSVILFQNEVQSDIYFVHKGKCFVYDWFLILDAGSIIGDIRRTGKMENRVYALTQVEMLKISSNEFFMIINTFDSVEANFLYRTKNAENFVEAETQSSGFQLHPVDSRDVLNAFGLQNKAIGFEDRSYFEDPDHRNIYYMKTWSSTQEKFYYITIYPGTWAMRLFRGIIIGTAFLTVVVITTLISFGSLTFIGFFCVAFLDCIWLTQVFLQFRVGYIDSVKGHVITDFKFIAKQYLKRWNGFVMDVLTLIPFEVIPICTATTWQEVDANTVALCRSVRLLRSSHLSGCLRSASKELKRNHMTQWLQIMIFIFIWLIVMVNVYICITAEPQLAMARDPFELGWPQFRAFTHAFLYVINFLSSANLSVIIPYSMPEVIYFNVNILFSPFLKGWIISKAVSILFVKNLAIAYYKSQVLAIESYLVNKAASPTIVKNVLSYKLNLLLFSRSENMPSFLIKAPTSLRMAIMKDLYFHHLKQCSLFEDTDDLFLTQLLGRMRKEVYFSGQKIVEQFDVDHRMYFVHRGEVYVINHTKDKAYVEYVIGKIATGEYFGLSQGLWYCRPHPHTYRARTHVEVIVLHANAWMDLRRSFPETAMQILNKAKAMRLL